MFLWDKVPDHFSADFSFPINKSELFSDNPTQLPSRVISLDEVREKIPSVCEDIDKSPLHILIHFSVLASALNNVSSLRNSTTFEVLKSLIGGGNEILSFIGSIADKSKQIQTTAKQNSILTSCLKRLVYLLSEIFVDFFRLFFRDSQIHRKNISNKKNTGDTSSTDLLSLCEDFFGFVNSVLSTEVMKIFSPPILESTTDTIRVMFAPVYTILNQNVILKNLYPKLVQSIFLCVNRFPPLMIEVGLKISEVLLYTEAGQGASTVLHNFLKQIIELIPHLCGMIIREITSRFHSDKDIPEVRVLGSVLATVACCDHVQVKSNVSYITPLLSAECYNIRNGALTALTEIIRGNSTALKEPTFRNETSVSPPEDLDEFGLGGIANDMLECKLLNTLTDHLFDTNAFVRSRCVSLICTLWEGDAIPLTMQNSILQILVGRLLDKSAIVRKHSFLSLVLALKKQPYNTGNLDNASFLQCYEREVRLLREIESRSELRHLCNHLDSIDTVLTTEIQEFIHLNEYVEMIKSEPTNEDCLFARLESEISIGYMPDSIAAFDWLKRYSPNETIFQNEAQQEHPVILGLTHHDLLALSTIIRVSKLRDSQDYLTQYKSQKLKVMYLQSAIEFIRLFKECLPTAIQFLNSKTHSDVISAIAFLTEYRKFKLPDHLLCINPILFLIWSPQQTHQECALNCFSEFFMDKSEHESDYNSIALTLAKNLLVNINFRELNTFENIVTTLVKQQDFSKQLIMALINNCVFSPKLPGADIRVNALVILCMIGKGDPSVLYDNMHNLINLCFAKKIEFEVVQLGSRALNILTSSQNKVKFNIQRFRNAHKIFNSILLLLSSNILDSTLNWTSLMHEGMVLIFQLSQSPLELSQLIILKCQTAFQLTLSEEKRIVGFSRFFCLLGKVAQLHLIMVDTILCRSEMTLQNDNIIEEKEDETVPIFDFNSDVLLEQLLCEGSLLSKFTDTIVQILKDQEFLNFASEFTNETSTINLSLILQLQCSALYALSQFMLLSNDTCEKYLNLIITLMTNQPCPYLRISCLNILSDLILRYPNALQPWISYIFMVLRDSNRSVRKHAILVLSHLIHINMVRVQGYIVEIAYLIYDEDPSISELAHSFFLKIAQGNSLYNVLPDIISHMFDVENSYLEIDTIKQILKFLFSLIRKEKQVGNLLLKFLQRFKSAKDNKQSELISFAISLLPLSEHTLTILVTELFALKSVISDTQTKSHFMDIYHTLRRQPNLQQGFKDLLNRYFELLNSIIISEN